MIYYYMNLPLIHVTHVDLGILGSSKKPDVDFILRIVKRNIIYTYGGWHVRKQRLNIEGLV